jgi:DNA-binding transcriptional LysR family regulator
VLDLRSLETFVWVAQLGGFRSAAARLNTTQPAVSSRIALLERALGVRLFERTTRHTALTAKGAELLGMAERMLQLRAEMVQAMGERAAIRGTIRLGCAETIVHAWLPRLVERVSAVHPGITLEIEVDISPHLRRALVSRALDIAFLLGPVAEPRIESRPLCRFDLAWAASPKLALPKEPIPLAALARVPLVTYPRATEPYAAIVDLFARHKVRAPRVHGSASLSTIVRMAADGIGVAAIPPAIIARELAEKSLRLVRVEGALPPLAFAASWPLKPDGFVAAAVAKLAHEVADEFAAGRRSHRV